MAARRKRAVGQKARGTKTRNLIDVPPPDDLLQSNQVPRSDPGALSSDAAPHPPDSHPHAATLWTLAQAGTYLGIRSHVTMRQLVRDQGLPVVRLGERVIRTRQEWIDEWLSKRRKREEGGDGK